MEELKQFCEAGMPVTLLSSWEEFNTAKQLLTSHGYIQITGGAEEEEEAGDAVFFIKQEIAEEDVRWDHSPFTFPSEVPQLERASSRAERSGVHEKLASEEEEEAEDAISLAEEYVGWEPHSSWDLQDPSPCTFPSEVPQLKCGSSRAERSDANGKLEGDKCDKRSDGKKEGGYDGDKKEGYKWGYDGEKKEGPSSSPKKIQAGCSWAESTSDSEWKLCACFQLNVPSHKQVDALIPKLGVKTQQVGIKLVVQPFAKIDETQLYIKLCIETLTVRVPESEFLTGNSALGYYPYSIRIMLEPKVAGSSDLAAIPKQGSQDQIDPAPSVNHTSDTTVSVHLEAGLGGMTVQHHWGKEWQSNRNKQLFSLKAVDADGNAASFEWRILRWKNETEYVAEGPLGRKLFVRLPELPFPGNAPTLKFPDIVWRFKRGVKDQQLKFMLRLDVKMHLVWSMGSHMWLRSPGFKQDEVHLEKEFPLELPQSLVGPKRFHWLKYLLQKLGSFCWGVKVPKS